MVKISVIMSVYNTKEEYLKLAIESVLEQTFGDFEFFIINDASTNNVEDVVLSYSDARIIYIKNEKNSGAAFTRNVGFKKAQGKYIAIMDSDDISLPHRFETQVNYLDNNLDVSILGSAMEIFPEKSIRRLASTVDVFSLIQSCEVAHPTVMMRRSAIVKHELFYRDKYIVAEDYDIWARAVKVTKIRNLDEVLLRYRVHAAQLTQTKQEQVYHESKKIQKDLLKFLTEDEILQHNIALFIKFDSQTQKDVSEILEKYSSKRNTFLENIFSVKSSSSRRYKIITIFWIRIKIRKK